MRHSTFKPHPVKLLAGALAALASGHTLAETAGRVSFVSGSVSATGTDGQTRTLRRGDLISGGDRIETRGGRLQIRFTDGGFVSLQPNTVFGVDQYLYANAAPEESSLFFSLLRGGMRTITGAIGKVNKQNYRVRTPVATIGIRGTGYLAETDNERTLVTVGHGRVFVENALGNVTGSAGENILATLEQAPGLTRETPDIRAPGPEGDEGDDDLTGNPAPSGSEALAFGEQVLPDGAPLLAEPDAGGGYVFIEPVLPPVLLDTDLSLLTPLYSFSFPFNSNTSVTNNLLLAPETNQSATFDQGNIVASRGGLLTLTNPDSTPLLSSGSLKFSNVSTVGSLSYGEMTDGSGTFAPLGTLTLSNLQFLPYVVGTTVATNFLPSGTATFDLVSGTAPRHSLTTAGTLDTFRFVLDLDWGRADVELKLTMNGEQYTASGSGLVIPANGTVFSMQGVSTTSLPCITAPNAACSTDIKAFLAGSSGTQLGATYLMTTTDGSIYGSAALGLGSLTPYAPVTPLPDSTANVPYSVAAPTMVDGPQTGLQATFFQSGSATELGGLKTLTDAVGTVLDSGTLQFGYRSIATRDNLAWGEYTEGSAAIDNFGITSPPPFAGEFSPYIVGTSTTTLFSSGTAVYTLQGSSVPTVNRLHDGATTLDRLDITLDFDFGLLDLQIGVTSNGLTVDVAGTDIPLGNLFSRGTFMLDGGFGGPLSVTGTACANSTCLAYVNGFFAGDSLAPSTQIGVAYALTTDVGGINGVAALGTDPAALVPAGSILPDAQLYTLALNDGLFGGYPSSGSLNTALQGNFDAAGALVSATSTYPSVSKIIDNVTVTPATVSDVGTTKTLSWGRFHSGQLSYQGSTLDLAARKDSLHYMIGQETPANYMADLFSQGGSATYALIGHTTGSLYDPSGLLTVAESSLAATLTADFLASTMNIDMAWSMNNGSTYALNSALDLNGTARFSATGLATTGTGGACASTGCATSINGFFSGQQAEQVGLVYAITDDMYLVKGAAAFQKQ